MSHRPPFIVRPTTTRAEIQHEIEELRHHQDREPVAFARTHDDELSDLLDALLAREPEPA